MTVLKNEDIREKYVEKISNYEKLGINIKTALQILIEENQISFLDINSRIKDTNSFLEKIDRKKYKDPFKEIDDICGVRIICYYRSDVDKICDIIKKEFDVIESQDKEDLLSPDQFGYRSYHFIVKIKEAWFCTPNYNGLQNLRAEIQVRTILMHTWAEIEHKLEYKKEDDIPNKFKRRFSRISAKLEESDEQLEELKNDINKYREEVGKELEKGNISFDNEVLNLDNLQAFLDYHFNDRKKSIKETSGLIAELKDFNINSISQLNKLYEKSKVMLPELEVALQNYFGKKFHWVQVGALRGILCLTIDGYIEGKYSSDEGYLSVVIKYREKLKSLK